MKTSCEGDVKTCNTTLIFLQSLSLRDHKLITNSSPCSPRAFQWAHYNNTVWSYAEFLKNIPVINISCAIACRNCKTHPLNFLLSILYACGIFVQNLCKQKCTDYSGHPHRLLPSAISFCKYTHQTIKPWKYLPQNIVNMLGTPPSSAFMVVSILHGLVRKYSHVSNLHITSSCIAIQSLTSFITIELKCD
jgi:hypothetical protein